MLTAEDIITALTLLGIVFVAFVVIPVVFLLINDGDRERIAARARFANFFANHRRS